MEESVAESLSRLRGLQRDLSSLTATTLPNIERLEAELKDQVAGFHALLDKKPRSDASRKALSDAKESIELGDHNYAVTQDFKQQSLELADALDLDELHAAHLLTDGFSEASTLDRSPLAAAVYLFHQRRQYLLECLRLTFEKAYGDELELPDELNSIFQSLAGAVFDPKQTGTVKNHEFWDKCTQAMRELETKSNEVAERLQSVSVTGANISSEFAEIMAFQSDSLRKQHESLGAILYWICRGNWTDFGDLKSLIARVKTVDRYDSIMLHYLPSLLQLISSTASPGRCTADDAKSVHQMLCSKVDSDAWVLRTFQAAVIACWLADYSARFNESPEDAGLETRNNTFGEALKDGGFHFLLSIASEVGQSEWFDPARKGITSYLVADAPTLQMDVTRGEEFMSLLVLERLQYFAESYITNMPDSLRKLKFDEDEQRRQVQNINQFRTMEFDLHLERFLLIIAYAFESNPQKAEAFWDDADGNLYGFISWSSQRQSTPRAAAFCEMLCALSLGEDCANHAHAFLIDEASMASAKLRRSSPLSWNHVLRELGFFAANFKSRVTAPPSYTAGRDAHGDYIEEPESELMVECYLRLIAHLSRESSDARQWLLSNQGFNLVEYLIQLCGSALSSRTRACAFTALANLLSKKDDATHKNIWNAIDSWMYGQSQSTYGRVPTALSPLEMEKIFFRHASTGFEEPNSVVGLFTALITPVVRAVDFNDSLPFPEDLGTKYRMTGIDAYVDFVMNHAFAQKTIELQDPVQLRILRLNCLTFAATCLSSFNEDLITFAQRTKLVDESVLAVSSLMTYIRIHPFARVMEWLFNSAVISALFATAVQDITEVNNAAEESPLVLGVLRSLEVLELVLAKQGSYLDLVRPAVRQQANAHRQSVASSALGTFEDAVLNHLDLVRALGIYSASGHTQLAATSLRLLQRLSGLPKLATPVAGGGVRPSDKSRIISAMEKGGEASNVSRSLAAIMEFDQREAEGGVGSPGIAIKTYILQFLSSSLETLNNRPTLAHLLLGFGCNSHTLYIDDEGLFAEGSSLFQALVSFIVSSPDGEPDYFVSWLLRIKADAIRILRQLWRSPVSSSLTLQALRENDFLLNMAIQESIITSASLWEGFTISDPAFYVRESALGLAAFLRSRAAFLECAAMELRISVAQKNFRLRSRIQASMFGSTTLLDGQQFVNPTIFGYLDFLDIDVGEDLELPQSASFPEDSFSFCQEISAGGDMVYNMTSVQQAISLRISQLRQKTRRSSEDAQVRADAENILQVMVAHNQRFDVLDGRLSALRAWLELAGAMLECGELDATQMTAFVLQLLQQMLPRLEKAYSEDSVTALLFAQFGLLLLKHTNFDALQKEAAQSSHTANDRLFQLFRVAAVGLQNPDSSTALRETCAQLCQQYIRHVCEHGMPYTGAILKCIKSMGDKLMSVLCDDAYGGEGPTKVSALLCLEAIVGASNEEDPTYVLGAMARVNFIQATTDSLGDISRDLQMAGRQGLATVVEGHRLSLQLLVRIAQSRPGAKMVIGASFFGATRNSGIFSIDPDIGWDMDNADAMRRYLELTLAFSRVMAALVVSLGHESELMLTHVRRFLQDHRTTIGSMLKLKIGIGRSAPESQAVLDELVDNLMVLMTSTQFVEAEEQNVKQSQVPRLFT